MDLVFKALADPTRRKLLDRLHADNGQTLGELCEHLAMTRQAVTKHLVLLEDANLIATVRRGREKLHYLNPVPIHEIAERWIGKFERSRLDALSDPQTIRKYWFGITAECDWKPGSPWSLKFEDGRTADSGEILEAVPPKRLAIPRRNQFKPAPTPE